MAKAKTLSLRLHAAIQKLYKSDFMTPFRKRVEKENPNMAKVKDKTRTSAPIHKEETIDRMVIDFKKRKPQFIDPSSVSVTQDPSSKSDAGGHTSIKARLAARPNHRKPLLLATTPL